VPLRCGHPFKWMNFLYTYLKNQYPPQLKFSFGGVFKKERKFVIKVETVTTATVHDCARMCEVIYKLVGGVDKGEKAKYSTELSHFILKDSDLKNFKCGSVCYGGARWYIVLFEKKTKTILTTDEFDYTNGADMMFGPPDLSSGQILSDLAKTNEQTRQVVSFEYRLHWESTTLQHEFLLLSKRGLECC